MGGHICAVTRGSIRRDEIKVIRDREGALSRAAAYIQAFAE